MNAYEEMRLELTANLEDYHFTQDEIKKIINAFTLATTDFEVTKKCTELMSLQDADINTLCLNQFILSKTLEGRSQQTLHQYRYRISLLLNMLTKPITKINSFDIRNFLLWYMNKDPKKPLSCITVENERKSLSSFFKWMTANDIIQKNPMLVIAPIRSPKSLKMPFTKIEMEKIRNACGSNSRDRALIEMLYASGARVGEVSALDISDVDFQNQFIIVNGKGNKERKVYINDVAAMYLKDYIDSRKDNNSALFVTLKSPYNRLTKDSIEKRVSIIGEKAGVADVYPHKFRRTLATDLSNKGVDIQCISKILGHASIETTKIYCIISDDRVQQEYKKTIG